MMASLVALLSCFALKSHPGTAFQRKLFSTMFGLFIQYYVFGKSGLASLFTNLISYVVICLAPSAKQHIVIFIISGLFLAFS